VQQYMKKYIEIREGWAKWATTFDCHWKCMASLARD